MSDVQYRKDLDAAQLRLDVDYNPITGKFYKARGRGFGKELGTLTSRGYIKVWIGGASHLAHRLAWLYMHGEWPSVVIDHINGVQTDNRIANLRDVSHAENSMNRVEHRANFPLDVNTCE